MPIKIKSRIAASRPTHSPTPDTPATPLRHPLLQSQGGSGSGLRNLSQQRDRKKMERRHDSSIGKESNKQLMDSLVNLEQQYGHMVTLTKSNRRSVKRSLVSIKGIPHTTITLKPRASAMRDTLSNQSNLSFNSTNSRANSVCGSQSQLRVVSIGSLCQNQKKRSKKRGIEISLTSTVKSRRVGVA